MRTILGSLSEALRWLTGSGATRNAGVEVNRAARAVTDLETQLQRVFDPSPQRAA